MTPETRNKKLNQMVKLEAKAQALQAQLDKIQSQWETLKDEVNTKGRFDGVKPVRYNFSDVLA